jgi:alkylation response protein AidB-like acyl-CoA dehydrogenase
MESPLLTEAQRQLMEETRDFVAQVPRELLRDMDADKVQYPTDYLREAGRRKLLGLRFDPACGGRGLRWEDEVVALEEIGVLGSSLACLYSLVSIVGEAIHVFGTPDQKERYLRGLVEGRLFPAEGLTEPRGGSDFFGATTRARRDGDRYLLSGQKRFVVGAEGADLFLVYARTADQEPHRSISAFIVERQEAIRVEYLYGLLGTRGGGAGRIVFDEATVPLGNVVLGENRGGEVFNQMMIPERLTTAAGSLGLARSALEIAARYSDRRKAFGRKIRQFQAVSFKIADSATRLDAARALVRTAAQAVDLHGSTGTTRRLVSEAKKFATQAAWAVVNDAMQVLGGIGYTNVFPVEKLLRDARVMMIWTGTNEVMDLIIQHEYLQELFGSGGRGLRDVEADAAEADAADEKIFE